MKIAVLETGVPPAPLAEQFGSYPDMFADLLGPKFELETFDAEHGELPDVGAHGAYLITGSPAGVYDPLPWIPPLMEFIRSAKGSRMIGVCFGHQVMAQALGGEVIKSPKGWAAGLNRYDVVHPEPWTNGERQVAIPASSWRRSTPSMANFRIQRRTAPIWSPARPPAFTSHYRGSRR
jgi:GMP synthase-like glutamine amidotransferase